MDSFKITTIFFVFLSFGFIAQTKQLDSLRNEVYSYSKEDTTKVRLLYEYHESYLKEINFDSLLKIEETTEKLANRLNDNDTYSKLMIMKGKYYYKKNLRQKSIESFTKASNYLSLIDHSDLKYEVETYLGINYYLLGYYSKNLDSCILHYNNAIKYAKGLSTEKQVKAFNRVSQAYSTLGKNDSVLYYNRKILAIANSSKKTADIISYYVAQYNYYMDIDLKDSVFHYMKSAYNRVLLAKDTSIKYKKTINAEYLRMGNGFYTFEEFDSALVYFDSCISLSLELQDYQTYGRALNISTFILTSQGKNEEVLKRIQESINLGFKIGDTTLIAKSMVSMTRSYDAIKDYDKAIKINNDLIDNYLSFLPAHFGLTLLSNQSYLYHEVKDYKNAIKFGLRALTLDSENPAIFYNLADAYLAAYSDTSMKMEEVIPKEIKPEEFNNALTEEEAKGKVLELVKEYYEQSIVLLEEKKNKRSLVHPYFGLGNYYDLIKDEKKTIYNYNKAWEYSKGDNISIKDQLRIASRLYELNKQKKKTSETLKWLEIRDSLEKVEASQNDLASLGKKQAEFEYSQKIYADSLEQKQKDLAVKYEQEKQALKLKSEEEKKYYLYGGLLLLAIFLFVLYRRFKIALKQKHLIELQKETIEEKRIALRKTHEGIQDSINYSKRIQKAVFPSMEKVKDLFPTSFLFFKPKDIVSGDFYWVHEVKGKKIIVTADCTGHGVPGAFMTIIGINILKEIVQEGIVDASIILKEINQRLIDRLSQNGKTSVKDGMDLALCIIDSNTIEFVGAHLPLYHVREGELIEYKGSNIFLGSKSAMPEPKVHHIPYQPGDLIYMSTDGLPDQKGGEKGKKFYSKRLKDFLLVNSSLTMEEQEASLVDLRKDWLANKYEQLDDITVVGVKL